MRMPGESPHLRLVKRMERERIQPDRKMLEAL